MIPPRKNNHALYRQDPFLVIIISKIRVKIKVEDWAMCFEEIQVLSSSLKFNYKQLVHWGTNWAIYNAGSVEYLNLIMSY